MVKASAVAEPCVIGIVGSVLRIFDEFLSLVELVVPSKKIDEFCEDWILIGLFLKHTLKLFHGFFILITFQ